MAQALAVLLPPVLAGGGVAGAAAAGGVGGGVVAGADGGAAAGGWQVACAAGDADGAAGDCVMVALGGSFVVWFLCVQWVAKALRFWGRLSCGWRAESGGLLCAGDCGYAGVVYAVGCGELGVECGSAAGDVAWVGREGESGGGVSAGASQGQAGGDQPRDGDREDCVDRAGDRVFGDSAAV